MNDQAQELFGMVALLMIFVVSAMLWNYYWVKPHDEFVFAVMECLDLSTHSDVMPTQDEYELCAQEVRSKLERR